MDRDLDKIIAQMTGRADFYGLDPEAKALAVTSSVELFDKIAGLLPEAEASALRERTQQMLDWLGDALFMHVNPKKFTPSHFEAHFNTHWSKFRNSNAIHVELGTWTAWPDARVAAYVEHEQLGDFIRLDMNTDYGPDLAASVTSLPFADSSIDRISSNSLFEHVAYPHEILREVFRVLRPGGALYTAVPFHFVQHACPRDYLRYTGDFFEDVGKDLGFSEIHVDTTSTSGLYYTLHTLGKSALVEPSLDDLRRRFAQTLQLSIIGTVALGIAMDEAIVAGGASHWHTTHVLAIKPGDYSPQPAAIDRSLPFLDRHASILMCPRSGAPLHRDGDALSTPDRQHRYSIVNGIPNLFELHGRSSATALQDECQRLREENALLRKRIDDL